MLASLSKCRSMGTCPMCRMGRVGLAIGDTAWMEMTASPSRCLRTDTPATFSGGRVGNVYEAIGQPLGGAHSIERASNVLALSNIGWQVVVVLVAVADRRIACVRLLGRRALQWRTCAEQPRYGFCEHPYTAFRALYPAHHE
jgi:hypothetical protein